MRYVLVVLVLVGCGTDASAPAIVPELSIIAGDAQTDTVGKTLPQRITAALRDRQSGAPLAGRVVNWVVVEGGGGVFAGVVQTGADGLARQQWTLGTAPGNQKLVARWIDPDTGEPVTVDTARAMAVSGVAASFLVNFSGSNVLAVGDTGIIAYWYEDQFGNGTTACTDRGSPDRVVWSSADTAALEPLGTTLTLSNGKRATQVVARGARTYGVDVSASGAACAPSSSNVGVSYLIR